MHALYKFGLLNITKVQIIFGCVYFCVYRESVQITWAVGGNCHATITWCLCSGSWQLDMTVSMKSLNSWVVSHYFNYSY